MWLNPLQLQEVKFIVWLVVIWREHFFFVKNKKKSTSCIRCTLTCVSWREGSCFCPSRLNLQVSPSPLPPPEYSKNNSAHCKRFENVVPDCSCKEKKKTKTRHCLGNTPTALDVIWQGVRPGRWISRQGVPQPVRSSLPDTWGLLKHSELQLLERNACPGVADGLEKCDCQHWLLNAEMQLGPLVLLAKCDASVAVLFHVRTSAKRAGSCSGPLVPPSAPS